jgi:chromosome segregation ATPase
MQSRGEIEDIDRLQAQVDRLMTEQEQWSEGNEVLDGRIKNIQGVIVSTESKHSNEIMRLKEQLLAERERTESIKGMVVKLSETVDGAKNCESLAAAASKDRVAQLEADSMELASLTDRRSQLVNKLSEMRLDLKGMLSCRQLLTTACRSCKTRVKHEFRRQLLEGNFSEMVSSITTASRSEVNRKAVSEIKRANCKCLLM